MLLLELHEELLPGARIPMRMMSVLKDGNSPHQLNISREENDCTGEERAARRTGCVPAGARSRKHAQTSSAIPRLWLWCHSGQKSGGRTNLTKCCGSWRKRALRLMCSRARSTTRAANVDICVSYRIGPDSQPALIHFSQGCDARQYDSGFPMTTWDMCTGWNCNIRLIGQTRWIYFFHSSSPTLHRRRIAAPPRCTNHIRASAPPPAALTGARSKPLPKTEEAATASVCRVFSVTSIFPKKKSVVSCAHREAWMVNSKHREKPKKHTGYIIANAGFVHSLEPLFF